MGIEIIVRKLDSMWLFLNEEIDDVNQILRPATDRRSILTVYPDILDS
jgi:hypothetical protein